MGCSVTGAENVPRSCDPYVELLGILGKSKKAARLSERIMIAFKSKANAYFSRQPVFTTEFDGCQQ